MQLTPHARFPNDRYVRTMNAEHMITAPIIDAMVRMVILCVFLVVVLSRSNNKEEGS